MDIGDLVLIKNAIISPWDPNLVYIRDVEFSIERQTYLFTVSDFLTYRLKDTTADGQYKAVIHDKGVYTENELCSLDVYCKHIAQEKGLKTVSKILKTLNTNFNYEYTKHRNYAVH